MKIEHKCPRCGSNKVLHLTVSGNWIPANEASVFEEKVSEKEPNGKCYSCDSFFSAFEDAITPWEIDTYEEEAEKWGNQRPRKKQPSRRNP